MKIFVININFLFILLNTLTSLNFMRCTQKCVGECEKCGDELYVFKTSNRKRFVQCANDECNQSFPLPAKGSLEETGELCPLNQMQILAIVPNLRLQRGNYRKQEKRTYFWTIKPCFTCREYSHCKPIQDLLEEYIE